MIQYPPWPVLGGGPRISAAIVALASDDTTLTGPGDGNDNWTDGVGWDPEYWSWAWASARADLQSTFEEAWGDLRDKLYWYITAPVDPETPDGTGTLDAAIFFLETIQNYLAIGP